MANPTASNTYLIRARTPDRRDKQFDADAQVEGFAEVIEGIREGWNDNVTLSGPGVNYTIRRLNRDGTQMILLSHEVWWIDRMTPEEMRIWGRLWIDEQGPVGQVFTGTAVFPPGTGGGGDRGG